MTDPQTESGDHDRQVLRAPAFWQPWSDGFGRLAIRSIQVIVVVTVLAGVAFVIQHLTLVTIPLVLALILASALAPIMSWLKQHKVPRLLATVITLLGVAVTLGLLGWLIAWAVIDEWDELSTQAQDGFQKVMAWIGTLPFELPNQEQIEEWLSVLRDFLLSSDFGSGALAGVGTVASFIAGLGLMIVVLFFFLKGRSADLGVPPAPPAR